MYKRKFPLPSASTLRRWAASIKLTPGILGSVLELMGSLNYSDRDKLCVISFDEMKIRKCYEYDKSTDSTLNPSNYVQVIIVRGLLKNWKQPIFYDYDCKITMFLINEVILKLSKNGYKVVALVSDMGLTNQSFWKQIGVSFKKSWFISPVNEEEKVFVFADVPHLIKLIRNHFIDSGFIVGGVEINVDPIKELIEIEKSCDLKISHKVTDFHLTVANEGRQSVKLATQLFSHSVSSCLRWIYANGKSQSKNVLECAYFIKLVNDWFDVFNAKMPSIDSRERMKAFGLALEEQVNIIIKMSDKISNLRVCGKKNLLPFQKGVLLSNSSLVQLYEYLKSKYNIEFIITYRLNQDVIENFFSAIRSKGGLHDHPTAIEFKYRLRGYILGNIQNA